MLAALLAIAAQSAQPHIELRLLQTGADDYGNPKLAALLINESDQPITLTLPGDGSDAGWRTPVLGWIITPDDGDQLPVPFRRRCGNMNAAGLADTFTLAQGREKRIDTLWAEPFFPEADRYRVALTYKNDPALGVPTSDPEAQRRARASTPVELVSNEVLVDYEPRGVGFERSPLERGEISPQWFAHIATCVDDAQPCTDLQLKIVDRFWSHCATRETVAATNARERIGLAAVLAKRGEVLAQLELKGAIDYTNGDSWPKIGLTRDGGELVVSAHRDPRNSGPAAGSRPSSITVSS